MKRLTQTRIQPFGRTAARLLTGMALAIAGVLACVAAWPAGAGNPNALWQVVHDLCVVDLKASGSPAPCSKVDLARGIAVLKDIRGATQLLLIPTQRVSGVEDPQLLEPQSPNYWQAAWEARDLLAQRAGKPLRRDEIGLAINSIYGRTQNQLHIHIDCIAPDVQRTLQADESKIGPHWAVLSDELAAHHYRVMRLDGADLGSRDPFKLVAEDDPAARLRAPEPPRQSCV
jgi:CDP-diacylglycerol pyrophosphatase